MAAIYRLQNVGALPSESRVPACGMPRCSLYGWMCDGTARSFRVSRGEAVVRNGDRFTALNAVRVGSCKAVATTMEGGEQVVGWYLSGESFCVEAMVTRVHDTSIVALEGSEICEIATGGRRAADAWRDCERLLAPALAHQREVMRWLGALPARGRLAAFLLDMSARHCARGYSSQELVLQLTRREVGSYLGIEQETVSRVLSRFQRHGLVGIHGRTLRIIDRAALQRFAGVPQCRRAPETQGRSREERA